MSRAVQIAVVALGAMLVLCSPALGRTLLGRTEDRAACYSACMDSDGWAPVCVYSPSYPKPTSHMPEATWVMPNNCTVACKSSFAKYEEYFSLEVSGDVEGLPEDCSTDSSAIEAIYFEFSDDSELAESCRRC